MDWRKNWRKVVALEWLIVMACFLVGLTYGLTLIPPHHAPPRSVATPQPQPLVSWESENPNMAALLRKLGSPVPKFSKPTAPIVVALPVPAPHHASPMEVMLSIYAIVQITRGTLWAIRTVRKA